LTLRASTQGRPTGSELEARRWAREYSALGWRVTPLRGKAPFLKQWPESAVSTESEIANWLTHGNVGLVTGEASGVVVIDVDPRNGGTESLEQLVRQCGSLPETIVCSTGGGGRHYYFRYFEGAKSGKPLAGIDFQCAGRCVVLPPSVHPDTGVLYEWERSPSEVEMANLPGTWLPALCISEHPRRPSGLQAKSPIPVGERNSTLLSFAIQLAKKGNSESRIMRLVVEENATRCQIPLNFQELESIVRSSFKYRGGNQGPLTRFQQAVGYADIPMPRKAVLWALGLFADQHGRNCYPTQEQIAERSGTSRKTANKHLAIAEAEGWIARFTHPRSEGPGYNYSYHLRVPDTEGFEDEN